MFRSWGSKEMHAFLDYVWSLVLFLASTLYSHKPLFAKGDGTISKLNKTVMQIAIEISMYPFRPNYEQPILNFIGLLKDEDGLRVQVNDMSTQIFGDFDTVMPRLQTAMKQAFTEEHTTVMVMKVLHVPE